MQESLLFDEWLTIWLKERFESVWPERAADFKGIQVVPSANPKFGDFQCNNAMTLAGALRMAPARIAEAVCGAGPLPAQIERMETAGPGFINITLANSEIARSALRLGDDPYCGVPRIGEGQTIVLDYSSPNIAKPMHIGHIRSTVIGNSLDRIFRAQGFEVIADNHIGDWGTQFGILIMGYRNLLDEENLRADPIGELERVYVASYAKAREDAAWMDACRAELVKLQAGDPENLRLWSEFVRLSMDEFAGIYKKLGVEFDLVRGESFYRDALPGVVERLRDEGLATESDGALVVNLEGEGLGVCIVRKSDGGYNYATTDIATVINRVEEFAPRRIVYVTDERQQLHFRQFFKVCRKLGIDEEQVELSHVWFGLMRLPDATFSTRQGNVIKLEALLDEAESRAGDILRESRPELPAEEARELARAIGIGAVKYADLSQSPQTLVTFSWQKALALDGNSGPYLQYAHARIRSVLDRYRDEFPDTDPGAYPLILDSDIERRLAFKVAMYPKAVRDAAAGCRPSVLAEALYDLAQTYSSFYQRVPFLKAEPGVRESRIKLCELVAKTLSHGLDLLGIESPERI